MVTIIRSPELVVQIPHEVGDAVVGEGSPLATSPAGRRKNRERSPGQRPHRLPLARRRPRDPGNATSDRSVSSAGPVSSTSGCSWSDQHPPAGSARTFTSSDCSDRDGTSSGNAGLQSHYRRHEPHPPTRWPATATSWTRLIAPSRVLAAVRRDPVQLGPQRHSVDDLPTRAP